VGAILPDFFCSLSQFPHRRRERNEVNRSDLFLIHYQIFSAKLSLGIQTYQLAGRVAKTLSLIAAGGVRHPPLTAHLVTPIKQFAQNRH